MSLGGPGQQKRVLSDRPRRDGGIPRHGTGDPRHGFNADNVRLTLVTVGAERARTVTVQMGTWSFGYEHDA